MRWLLILAAIPSLAWIVAVAQAAWLGPGNRLPLRHQDQEDLCLVYISQHITR